MRVKKAKTLLQVSIPTLISYREKGYIKATQNPYNGYWDYDEESIYSFLNKKDKRDIVVYGRVSTPKQSKDLENQINSLIEYANKNGYKVDAIYKDIASGLTYNRDDFKTLIKRVLKHEIKTIFITYKDRFSRVSFDMWKSICDECDCNIIILNTSNSDEKEIFEDIISLIHCFSMKMYSNRRKKKLNLVKQDLEMEVSECN